MPAALAAPDLAATIAAGARLPIAGFGLGFARSLAMLQILPLANRLGLGGMHRAGVAAAIALPMTPLILDQLGATVPDGGRLLLLSVKETLIGLVLGLLFAAPFWAAETAGELIDQQRGSRGAVTPDPAQQEENGITATLFVLTLSVIFILSGGLHWLFQAMFASYRIWTADALIPRLDPGAFGQIASLLDGVLAAGLVIAAPLLIAMLIAEFGLALVGRFVPQLNVFDLAMSVKGLVVAAGLPIYAVFLIAYFESGLAPLIDVPRTLGVLAHGGG